MSLELPDINDRDCRLTRVEMWRIVGLAVGGVLVFVGIGVAKLIHSRCERTIKSTLSATIPIVNHQL